MANVGVFITEGEASQASFVAGASTSNVGILLESTRGVPNTPVMLTSAAQARRLFGAPSSTSSGALVLRSLFNNAAPFGAVVYAVRIAGSGNAASTLSINAGSTKFFARVTGTGGNSYTVKVEVGTTTGKKFTFTNGGATTEVFDNVTDVSILRQAVNSGLSGYNSGAASTLVTVSYAGHALPDNLAQTNLTGGTTGVMASLVCTISGTSAVTVKAGQKGYQDPGTWGDKISLICIGSPGNEELRTLYVYLTLTSGEKQLVETWPELSPTTFASKINNSDTGSEYITVVGTTFPNGFGETFLASGNNGSATSTGDYIGDSAAKTGLYALDTAPVQIITSSDNMTKELADALDTYCLARGAVGVFCPPYNTSVATLYSTWTPLLQAQRSNLAVYRGHVSVTNETGGTQFIPNVGHVIGAGFIRNMMTKGGYPNVAPAGNGASFNDALRVEFAGYVQGDLDYLVGTVGINPVMYKQDIGFLPRTSRTMSTLSKNYSVHVRRSINYIIDSLKNSLGWVEQSANSVETRNTLTDTLNVFFQDLYNAGMFDKSAGYNGAVSIKCDSENNNSRVLAERRLVVDIVVRFADVAESIQITLQSTQESLLVNAQ